jgi:hypothetical protein
MQPPIKERFEIKIQDLRLNLRFKIKSIKADMPQ